MLAFTLAKSSSLVEELLAMRLRRFNHLLISSSVQFSGSVTKFDKLMLLFHMVVACIALTTSRIRLLRENVTTED